MSGAPPARCVVEVSETPLSSLTHYSRFVAELLNRQTVLRSTLSVCSDSPFTGVVEGESSSPTALMAD
jgi:hypothetical protein